MPGSLTDALRETLGVFDGSGEPLTTPEVAERLDLGRRSTYERLDRLVDHGELLTKEVGANARVWWCPPGPTDDEPPPEHGGRPEVEFESLVDAVAEYAIFRLDPEGHVESWNAGAERIKGYAADEILGEHVSTFYTEADREAGVPGANLAAAAEEGSVEDEGWRVRADGSRFWANVTITAVREDGDVAGYVKVTRDATGRHEYERRLREERDLVERILEAVPVGIGVLSPAGEVLRTNDRADELLGVGGEDAGMEFPDRRGIYDADGDPVPPDERPFRRVVETGEPVVDWQCRMERPDGSRRWLSVNAVPMENDGEIERVVVTGEDVTRRREQARRLERRRDELAAELEDVFDRVEDAFVALDDEWRFTYVNERAAAVFGEQGGELVGQCFWEAVPEAEEAVGAELRRAAATEEPASTEVFFESLDRWLAVNAYPSETGTSVYVRDVTDRKERERDLARYETIVESVDEGVYVVDRDRNLTWVNGAYAEMLGYSREELIGTNAAELVDDPGVIREAEAVEDEQGPDHIPKMELELVTASGDTVPVEVQSAVLPGDADDGWFRVGIVRDVGQRKERERQLRDAKLQLEAAAAAGDVGTWEWRIQADEFVAGPELAGKFGVDPGAAREGVSLDRFTSAVHEDDRDRVRRLIDEAVESCDEYEAEYRVRNGDGEIRWVVARGHVECDEDGTPETFPGALIDITERRERERELERQRERLATLVGLYDVFRETTDAVIEQSTRDEVEEIVCDHLVGAAPYEVAWIGEYDPQTESIVPGAGTGVEGDVEAIPLSTDGDDRAGRRPAGRAARSREVHVVSDAPAEVGGDDGPVEPTEGGRRSGAWVPIVHEDTLYGLLVVRADRPAAFDGTERDVIAQLGEVVGHAFAAIERKQALMSDEVTEVEFAVPDVLDAGGTDPAADATISLERVVPTGDGTFLEYGTVDEAGVPVLEAYVDRNAHFENLRLFDAGGEATRFELRVSDPPVASVVASHGGHVQGATIENGDLEMTIHLPPTVTPRRVVDAVREDYPGVELLARQRITRDDPPAPVYGEVTESLTERQRTALEAALYAGFFEWPRETTGEEVAESLDVAAPTFHQHLRKAQRKVLESIFPAPTSAREV